jgi:AcrR family transcriptional regulator
MDARPLPRKALVKVPRQVRSIQTVHAVLDAARRVLHREGAEALNTNRVAAVAGISPGSLYQYFADREMILAALVERDVLEARVIFRRVYAAGAGLPEDERMLAALDAWAARLEVDSELVAEVLRLAPLLSDHGVATVLEADFTEALRGDTERPVSFARLRAGPAATFVGVNALVFVLLKWMAEQPPNVPRRALVERIAWMLRLLVEQPASATP